MMSPSAPARFLGDLERAMTLLCAATRGQAVVARGGWPRSSDDGSAGGEMIIRRTRPEADVEIRMTRSEESPSWSGFAMRVCVGSRAEIGFLQIADISKCRIGDLYLDLFGCAERANQLEDGYPEKSF